MPTLSKLELSKYLPHGDTMCLLSSVTHWDSSSINCRTSTHRHQDNPLQQHGVLGILCGLEYAAQAMGVHVGLTQNISEHNASVGYLGAIRDIQVNQPTFQQIAEDLTIEAHLLLEQHMSFIYAFSIKAREEILLQGRASIFIQGPEAMT
ncbi:MAG: 3-hydroxylacyl-ACP dehydratase [Nitrospirota bacterium]|nr:3-hydroxylacyl-ACP dehydratase [Nitrospirota bacterium]MDH5587503.1 3-hydroxylacyl-ACP dehydratase [Nitrospirota bacterium]MDH5774623.1 3-hydroxylacyl-ACP dehydratase [Nitrospirota bacterium]